MDSGQQKVTERKKAPTFASMFGQRRSNSMTSFCRITGKSKSMDEHHYVFSSDDFPKFENLSGCRITEKHGHFKDYKYVYPILDLDGVTRMVTEHDFHCRITAKYKAMAGHKYVFPVLGAQSDKKVEDMYSIVDDEAMEDVIVPAEVELIIRGGIKDVLKLKEGEHIFIQSKEGHLFPAAMKEIFKRKAAPVANRPRRHTLPIHLEAAVVNELTSICVPEVKFVKDIKEPPAPMEVVITQDEFSVINENVEVLKDVRKCRPKRPGRSKNREKDSSQKKKMKKEDEEKEQKKDDCKVEETKEIKPAEEKKSEEPPKRLSRLDRFKSQFQSFEEQNNYRNTGSRLTFIGGFNEDEVEELDFSEPAEIQYIESQMPIESRAVITVDTSHTTGSSEITSDEKIIPENLQNHSRSELNGMKEELKENKSKNEDETVGKTDEQIPATKSFQELKSLIDSKLDLGKALKLQKTACPGDLNNNVISDHRSEDAVVKICEDSASEFGGGKDENKTETSTVNKEYVKSSEKEIETSTVNKKSVKSSEIDFSSSNKCKTEELAQSKLNYTHELFEEKMETDLNNVTNNNVITTGSEVRNSSDLHDKNIRFDVKRKKMFSSWKSRENLHDIDSIEKESLFAEQMLVDSATETELSSKFKSSVPTGEIILNGNATIHDATAVEVVEHPIDERIIQMSSSKLKTLSTNIPNVSEDGVNEQASYYLLTADSQKIESNEIINNNDKTLVNSNMACNNLPMDEDRRFLQKMSTISDNSNSCYERSVQMSDIISANEYESVNGCDKQLNNGIEKMESYETKSKRQNNTVKIEGSLTPAYEKAITNNGIVTGNQSINSPDKYVNGYKEKLESNEIVVKDSLGNALKSCDNNARDHNIFSGASLTSDVYMEENIKTQSISKNDDLPEKTVSSSYGSLSELEKGVVKVTSDSAAVGYSFETASDTSDVITRRKLEDDNVENKLGIQNVTTDINGKKQAHFNGIASSKDGMEELLVSENRKDTSIRKSLLRDTGEIAGKEILNSFYPNSMTNQVTQVVLTESKIKSANHFEISDQSYVAAENVSNGIRVAGVKKLDCEQAVPKPLESHFLSTTIENVLDSGVDLHDFEVRLPVTCNLLKKELLAECELSAIDCSPPPGILANISWFDSEAKWNAKSNNECLQGIDVYVAIMDFRPMESDEEAVAMKEGQQVEVIDASKPRRWLVRVLPMTTDETPKEGWVPACYLEKSTAYDTLESYVVTEADFDPKEIEAIQNREAIVKELVETEEDFAKDMQFVVENYYKQMDNPRLPKEFRDRKGSIFGNFKDISDFHNNVLMEGIHYHAKEPTKLGKTFLRLERDFDMHANYCWNEARAQQLLREGPLKEYFDDHSRLIDDDKLLADHLKLPIQRLNDYQLLLKELIKYSSRLKEDTADLQKALDFIHSINKRNRDLQVIQTIEGYHGDLLKAGKIIRQEVFDVVEDDQVQERYVFLFKGRLFVTEKRTKAGKETYHVTNLFKLQDVEIIEDVEGDPLSIVFRSHKKSRPGFPLTLRAKSIEQKNNWSRDVAAANQVVEDLGEFEPSLERPIELKHKAEELEEPDSKKPKVESLKRQDSGKKDSVPQTPTEEETRPPLSRQESVKKKTKSGDSTPQTPTENDKPPKLSRQESVKKKPKSTETSAPQTPVEETPPPLLKRQESVKKKSKSSAPQTPTEETEQPPPLTRQDSNRKSKKSVEEAVSEKPTVTRQDSLSKKDKKEKEEKVKRQDSGEKSKKPVEETVPELTRQESLSKKDKEEKVKRQDSAEKSKKPVEETVPELIRQESLSKKDKEEKVKRQDSVEKSKKPVEETVPELTRQESLSKKDKEEKVKRQDSADKSKKPLEESVPELTRQDSLSKKDKEEKVKRQDSKDKKADKRKGEESIIPTIIMSEDASGSDARVESDFNNEDNATLASESLRSDDSITPPASEIDPMDKPRFSKTLRGVNCVLGETAVLECETEGNPIPSVLWLKDNQKLKKSSRVKSSSQGQKHTLTIDEATADDAGLYTVVASSAKGTASCSAQLNLKIPMLGVPKEDSRPTTPGGTVLPHAPVFKLKLNKETQLLEGTSVRFELVVRGNPEPKIKFFKDNKELKLDERVRVSFESKEVFELILDHVVAKDAGVYSCVATNSEGEDKTVGNLSVVKNKDVFKGLEDTLLEEEREPTPRPRTPKFRWFKDGQYFEANERFQVIFNEEEDSLALMFQHVTPEDAGLYTCVASTSTGSKIACSAELTVQGVIRQVEAPGIKAQLTDVEATEGGSAMLELKITGFPKPKVTWYHKNKEVSTGGRYRFLFADEETFTLVIKNIKKDDSGKYSVKAVNEMGEAESSCNLSVKSAPSFIKGLKDMSVMAEEIIKFEVQIDGNPAPEVKWYKDGQQLTPSDRVKISNEKGKPTLQVLKAKQTDSGSYSCVLTNNIGSQAEFSNVVVKASPTFTKGLENVEGLEGDTLQFNVEVNGNPKPTIKWSKDGKELKVDGKHIKMMEDTPNCYTLIVDKATLADVGVYTCEIKNEHGLKASNGNLNLKTKPEFIKKLSDSECKEGEAITLSTMVKGYPIPSIKWFLGETELKDDKNYAIVSEKEGSYSLKVKKAVRTMSGTYTCKAMNEMGEASTSGVLTVVVTKKKPEIDQQLQATQLVETKPGKIVAKVSGEPKPKIQWLKDGKPIPKNDHFSVEESEDGTVALLIDKVGPSDAGLYSIVATNEDGEARSEAPVTTIPPGRKPEFVKELDKVELIECQPLKLVAKVIGKPTSIKWQKDGEDLSPSDTVRITEDADGTVALMISNVSQKDAGKYTVIATNAEGKARSTSLVQVQAVKKPELESGLEALTLKDGETGQLKAKVSGEPKPTIKWLKDGKELKPSNRVESIQEPDGTISLVIKNARPEDAGNYSFVAQNPKGEVKSSAPVTVTQGPTFHKPLGPVSVVEGFPAKLEAKLGGYPQPEITWLKDAKPFVPDGTHVKELRNPDGTVALLLDSCSLEDAGRFSLIAKNPLGEETSSGTLDVSGKEAYGVPKSAPSVLTPLGNLCVKEGEPIRFETEVTGNPLPDIAWTVNGKELKPSDNTLMTFDGKKAILEIKRSSPEHMGTFKCKLSNPLGEANTEGSVAVQEKAPPHFIQRLTDFNGFVNQPMKLTCKLTGYPEPEVDWYFNGGLINTNSPRYICTHIGDAHSLTISSPQPSDSGIYECKATNPLGEDFTRAAVDISARVEKGEPPMFLKKIGDNEVMEGMTAKFTACVTGIPTPDVSWVKEGNPLEPSPRHKMELESTGILRLIIHEVEQSDYGNYSVTISNIHGSATSSAKLCPDSLDEKYIMPIGDQFIDFDKFKKTGAPVPLPEKPRIIRMSDTSLTLGWKPSVPNAPRLPVTYQVEMASHPDGEWTPYKTGVRDTLCDVRDLRPGYDYKFRIRVENKHGVSEPSPYTTAHRSKIYEPPKPQDFLPKGYEIEHPPLQKYSAPPRFVRKEEDSMYGARGHPVTIEFWVYGCPEPQVTWFKGESQIGKDKYNFLQDRNGKLCVFIDSMSDDYVGTYTCVAVNDEGEASMKIKLLLAEHPVFTQKLDETTSMSRRTGRMQCCVTGLPYPKIKWFRDWHPLYESERVKILWEEPDKCTLFISNLITRDNALYSCTATNIAGTATSSAILNVVDSEETFDAKTYCRPTPVRSRTKPFEDFYDVGDELGRGTQGITYHAVKRETGDVYAAKTMHGHGKLKDFMKTEMEIMNQMCHPKLVRLRDAFETKDHLTLITDICGGNELLGYILKRGGVSEREVKSYVKQILEGLEYMHSRCIGHLGLTIGDVMISRVNSYDIKIGDFGLAARLLPGKDYFLEYGHPEFVAPEIANKQAATVLADMWSVGVMTYLLLSGISPFLGEHDRETLSRVQQGKINFVEDAFVGVSDDAKDFMSKLLVFDPKGRMDVKAALNHRWFKYCDDKPLESEKKLNNLDRLKEYQKRWKEWYDNASCKRYYRRRTLESCFHHPSKMIYPPGEVYTPETTPEPHLDRSHVKPSQFDDITFKQKINREEIDFRSESSYQNGPDTYLLQLRDTDFPLRLRQYLRVGASTSPALAANLRDTHWGDSTLVIRERRKFVDMMDEEIDDEKQGLIPTTVPRRIYHEVGTLGFAREQMELLKREVWKDKGSRETEIGMAPYFREKIRNASMKEGDAVVLRCYAIGKPKVDYSWFRNDGILLESSRVVVKELADGHCELRINPTRAYDAGVYKCVARNMHGTSCCRARLRLGSKPGRPEPPVFRNASDTEIYITWAVPRDEGQSTTLGYTLEYKQADAEEWIVICNNIEHEYFVVRNLLPNTFYQFRVKAYNKFGWGEPSFPTSPYSTKEEGAPKVKVSPRRKYQQEFTERTPDYELTEIELPEMDYSRETNPIPIVEGEFSDLYRIVSEMDRGRFSVVLNVWVKESNTSSVAKVIQTSEYGDGKQEYEIVKSLCHEKIVSYFSASYKADKTVLVMEKLSGVDVLSYLALRHDYNEEMVVTIIKQVLEALQYLHFREICYLELQPDNVVMVNLRDSDIKLVDFGAARFIPRAGAKTKLKGCPEYLAPEVLENKEVSTLTDVWCVGVLTFILLGGSSPFRGKDEEETRQNVTYVRYHFDNLNPDVTSEATRFLLNIFKQCPIKRLTIDECLEHKWLQPSEYMIMKRESARFLPDKLAAFARKFHMDRYEAMDPEMLTSLGMSSTKQELIIDF